MCITFASITRALANRARKYLSTKPLRMYLGRVQDAAAEQLYEVASNCPAYATSIADLGALGPLLSALQYSENPETQRAAAGTIRVLAECPTLRGRIHQAHAIPLLIQFASSKIVALAEQALGVLRYLALGGQYI